MKLYRYSVIYYDKYCEKYEEDHGLTFGETMTDVIENLNKDYGECFEGIKVENCYIEGDKTISFREAKDALKNFTPLNPANYE